MKERFYGSSIDDCLIKAEKALSLPKDKINYEIVKNGKGLFKKNFEIIVTGIKDEKSNSEEIKEQSEQIIDDNNSQEFENIQEKDEDIEVKLENNIIKISNNDKKFEIYYDDGLTVIVNGEEVGNSTLVSSADKIVVKGYEVEAIRKLELNTDSMTVKATTKYGNKLIYNPKLKLNDTTISIVARKTKGDLAPLFTKQEVENILTDKGIVFGIKEDAIEKITKEREIKNLIIAQGEEAVNDVDDKLEIKFEGSRKRNVEGDSKETIDYRNMYSIDNVAAGEYIAELIVGKEGKDGTNIFGNAIPRKVKKSIALKTAEGCVIEGRYVKALIDGQPTIKNGTFSIHKVLQTPSDVDLKSGNINFIGDVQIARNVKEGMKVEAGNTLSIGGNVESATIVAQGETDIKGSIINSTISIGAKDFIKKSYMGDLQQLKDMFTKLVTTLKQLRDTNKNFENISDGELVKLLIEKKFRNIIHVGMKILNSEGGSNNTIIKDFIRKKLIGLGPLKIKHYGELENINKHISEEIESIKEELLIPVDLYINYCQDTKINCTGTVYINGKGEYVSDIEAKGDIVFEGMKTVARGGTLVSGGNVKCKVIGSTAGVTTTIKVPKDGTIEADIAYHNTVFICGKRQYALEVPSKNVKVYLDEQGEIVVDKFVL